MTVMKRRNRMIAFRISEEDYERVYNVCVSVGARSVSDLARSAISRLIGREPEQGDLVIRQIEGLRQQVVQLEATVQDLSGRLAAAEATKLVARSG